MAMVRPTKAADFRSLSNEEIETEIYESRSEILVTRIKQQKKQVLVFLSSQLFARIQSFPAFKQRPSADLQAFKPELFSWNRRKVPSLLITRSL